LTLDPPAHASELAEAARFGLAGDEASAFVRRSRRARLRAQLQRTFYGVYPCRMAALHNLAATAIATARFAALSEVYDLIGEALVPVDAHGEPRTELWRAYVRAHEEHRPADYREECWIAAHSVDLVEVKESGLVERFATEHAAHPGDPTWDGLAEHMAVALGTRVQDRDALAGRVALETAIASALSNVVYLQITNGLRLVRTYVLQAARAVIFGGPTLPDGLPSDRKLVAWLVAATWNVTAIVHVWRLGVRRRSRGAERQGQAWSLEPSLAKALGPDLDRLHPRVRRFFDRMDAFSMTASVDLHGSSSRALAWGATLLVGQGMYEEHLADVDARFRLFQREDGSMHFVREFWCADAIRVFDSDFVVREVDGKWTLLEVFQDLGVAARMRTEVLDDGGLRMTVVGLFVRGVPVPVGPATVCFDTRPVDDTLVITGVLDLAARNVIERVLWRQLLRLPERVGAIRYVAKERTEATEVPA
jgi:hypothetical protein